MQLFNIYLNYDLNLSSLAEEAKILRNLSSYFSISFFKHS